MTGMVRGVVVVAVALAAAGCFFDSRVLQTKGFSPQQSAERRAAASLAPAVIAQPGPPHAGPVRTLKVRVWADASYRRRPYWRVRLDRIFGRTNGYLRHALGVEFEPDVREWDRETEIENLEPFLDELELLDPGEDVDLVVGVTAALPRLATSHEHLGRAWVLSRHMVMRAMNDALEREALAQAFPTLGRDELDELHDARTMHKEVAVLIHEWAHTLGAMHVEGGELMSPAYSAEAGKLGEGDLRLITLSLAARAGSTEAEDALRRHIAECACGWDPRERTTLMSVLARGGAGSRGVLAGARAPEPAEERQAAGEIDEATRAAEAHREAGRLREAMAVLDGARARAGEDQDGWRAIATAYANLGAYQRAAEALDRAGAGPPTESLRATVLAWRRQRGVYGVAADDEPEASAAAARVHELLFEDDRGARRALDGGLRRWPRHAGLLAFRCALELKAGRARAADAACKRALAITDEAMPAHYFAGHVAVRAGRRAAAMKHFERTIELDPDAAVAYESLAPLYREAGQDDKLAALRAAHQKQFRRALSITP